MYAQEQQDILSEDYAASDQADTQTGPAVQQMEPIGPSFWDYLSMVLGLGVVVVIIVVIFYAIKRGINKKIVQNELIKILGSKIVTGNKVLHLIEVGNAVYLIASSNEGISLISEVSDKETKDTIKLKASQRPENPVKGFGDLIVGFLNRKSQKKQVIDHSINFMKEQRSRLHKMNK